MTEIGRIKQLFRYPVKSMAGEELASAELGWHGIKGDRRYSFMRAGTTTSFPWLTASKLPGLVRYKAYHAVSDGPSSPVVHVRTPEGAELDVNDELLRKQVAASFGAEVSLIRVDKGIFDDFPISIISTTTIRALEAESGRSLDMRRFRPNLLIEPIGDAPILEENWLGKTIILGSSPNAPTLRVTIQDIRCVMVNVDPETAESDPNIFKTIIRTRNSCAGVYATVLNTGVILGGETVYIDGE